MSSINKSLTIDEQINLLKDKGLKFNSKTSLDIFKQYLEMYNYETIINKYRIKDFYQEDGQHFIVDLSSDDLRYLFDIDRTISSILWKYFKGIEFNFHSSLTMHLTSAFEQYLKYPYSSLLDEASAKIIFSNYVSKKYEKNFIPDYIEIEKYFLKFVGRDKNLLRINIENLKNEDRDVIDAINLKTADWARNSHLKKYAYVHLWALASSWTFSSLLWIYKALNDQIQFEIKNDFFKHLGNKAFDIDVHSFLELIEIFSDIRNKLAHNVKILDLQISINSDVLIDNINRIHKLNVVKNSKCGIDVVIKILEDILGIKENKIENEIKHYIATKINNSKKSNDKLIKAIINKYTKFSL
ncbi:MAG: Abi family protein [Mycoplasmoidaceae bacterium]